jgi:hypothetical protein
MEQRPTSDEHTTALDRNDDYLTALADTWDACGFTRDRLPFGANGENPLSSPPKPFMPPSRIPSPSS